MDNFIWGTFFGILITLFVLCILATGIAWGRDIEKKEKK